MSGLEKLEERIKYDLTNFGDMSPKKREASVRSLGRVLNTKWTHETELSNEHLRFFECSQLWGNRFFQL